MTVASFRRNAALATRSAPARWFAWTATAFVVFSSVILLEGSNPLRAYADILSSTLGSAYGLSEVLVTMTPLLITALAVTIPARIGLVNVGGEGQLFIGALAGSWVALTFTGLPSWLLLPAMAFAAFCAGGVWGGITGYLRAKGWLTEVFSTVLLNYVAILTVNALVFGPWRDPTSANYPQSREFVEAGRLPTFGDTRVHIGLLIGLIAIIAFDLFLRRTRWGLEMRAIGGNPVAAGRNGIPVARYMVMVMVIGGGLAGIAGIAQASGFQHRLSPGLSSGLGYTGFLISWVSGHRPRVLIPIAFLLAVLAAGGDILQITQGLPAATISVLSASMLLIVLAARARRKVAG